MFVFVPERHASHTRTRRRRWRPLPPTKPRNTHFYTMSHTFLHNHTHSCSFVLCGGRPLSHASVCVCRSVGSAFRTARFARVQFPFLIYLPVAAEECECVCVYVLVCILRIILYAFYAPSLFIHFVQSAWSPTPKKPDRTTTPKANRARGKTHN